MRKLSEFLRKTADRLRDLETTMNVLVSFQGNLYESPKHTDRDEQRSGAITDVLEIVGEEIQRCEDRLNNPGLYEDECP